jgi:hypothetical protein
MAKSIPDIIGGSEVTRREILESGRKFAASNYINTAQELGHTQNENIGAKVASTGAVKNGVQATLERLKTGSENAGKIKEGSTSSVAGAGFGAAIMGGLTVMALRPNGVMVGTGKQHDQNTHEINKSKGRGNKMLAKIRGMGSVDGGVYDY